MTDEDICKHMGWYPGFLGNLGRDDFAERVRSVVAAAEARVCADITTEIAKHEQDRKTLRDCLTELLAVHVGPKLNDETRSYWAVKQARASLAASQEPKP